VVDFEPGARAVFQSSAAIQRVLESVGIEFIAENSRGDGIRRRKRKGEAMSGRADEKQSFEPQESWPPKGDSYFEMGLYVAI
jgi:hypothetical protein